MKALFARFVRDTEGQDLIEYALLAATIAIGVGIAMTFVKTQLENEFSVIGTGITSGS